MLRAPSAPCCSVLSRRGRRLSSNRGRRLSSNRRVAGSPASTPSPAPLPQSAISLMLCLNYCSRAETVTRWTHESPSLTSSLSCCRLATCYCRRRPGCRCPGRGWDAADGPSTPWPSEPHLLPSPQQKPVIAPTLSRLRLRGDAVLVLNRCRIKSKRPHNFELAPPSYHLQIAMSARHSARRPAASTRRVTASPPLHCPLAVPFAQPHWLHVVITVVPLRYYSGNPLLRGPRPGCAVASTASV